MDRVLPLNSGPNGKPGTDAEKERPREAPAAERPRRREAEPGREYAEDRARPKDREWEATYDCSA